MLALYDSRRPRERVAAADATGGRTQAGRLPAAAIEPCRERAFRAIRSAGFRYDVAGHRSRRKRRAVFAERVSNILDAHTRDCKIGQEITTRHRRALGTLATCGSTGDRGEENNGAGPATTPVRHICKNGAAAATASRPVEKAAPTLPQGHRSGLASPQLQAEVFLT